MKLKKIFHISWPYTAVIGAQVIWGINFLVAKLTLQEFPLMTLAFLRFAIAFLLLAPFLLVQKNSVNASRKDLPWLFLAGVLMVTLNIAFFFAGLMLTDITTASAVTMSIPILTIAFGWLFLREKIYLFNLMGIIFGLAGAIIVIGLPALLLGSRQMSSEGVIGNTLILLASITWVAGSIISQKKLHRYSTLTVTAFLFLTGTLTFFIPAMLEYIQHPAWTSKVTSFGFFGLIYLAAASSVSAYFLFEWGLRRIGAVQSNLFQYLEPLIASALGILVLQETAGISFILGGVLIAAGVYWSTLKQESHKHHRAHRI